MWTKRVHKDGKTGVETPLPAATVDKDWASHLKVDPETQKTVARSWAVASVAMVAQVVPTVGPKDFLVVKREGKTEVWTKRAFKAHEIVLAPVGSQVKDAYWTAARSVMIRTK